MWEGFHLLPDGVGAKGTLSPPGSVHFSIDSGDRIAELAACSHHPKYPQIDSVSSPVEPPTERRLDNNEASITKEIAFTTY